MINNFNKNQRLTIKYSIVIPIYNGMNTFQFTFPWIIKNINRKDVEFIVVDNHSDDGLHKFVEGLNDQRIRLIRLNKKRVVGESLSCGLRVAKGEWVTYLGDDDQLLTASLDFLDKSVSKNLDIDIIIFQSIRFYWPKKNKKISSHLSKNFSGSFEIKKSSELIDTYINKISLPAGGSLYFRREILNKINDKYGYFSSAQGVEFFILRAALLISNHTALVDLPSFIHGRAEQGWGESVGTKSRWNDKKEFHNAFVPEVFWHPKLYTSISYDAAIRALNYDNKNVIKKNLFIRSYISEILSPAAKHRIEGNPLNILFKYLLSLLKTFNLIDFIYAVSYILYKNIRTFFKTEQFKGSNRGFTKTEYNTNSAKDEINNIAVKYNSKLSKLIK